MLAEALRLTGEPAQAKRELLLLVAGPRGLVRDEATIGLAEVLVEEGRAEEALRLLSPLSGKLVTQEAQVRALEATVRAAVIGRKWRLAVRSLVSWLALVGPNRSETGHWARISLAEVPIPAQSRLLDGWSRESWQERESVARDVVQRLLIDRVADAALSRRDARLARDLLKSSPAWLRASERGDELAMLAAFALEDVRVIGRKFGIVLGGPTGVATRRSIEVSRGVMTTLGGGGGVEFIAEDNRSSLTGALASLLGQGASLLLAGYDAESAAIALDFAERKEVPVIVFVDPGARYQVSTKRKYGFVMGVMVEQEREALRTALLAHGVVGIETIGDTVTPCVSRLDNGQTSYPWTTWFERSKALILLGDLDCARAAISQNTSFLTPLEIALGLEAARARSAGDWYLGAGDFPNTEGGVELSWYEALGVDATRLARQTLEAVPDVVEAEPDAVRKRHEAVRTMLSRTNVELSTSLSTGFAEDNALPRALVVRRVEEQRNAP